MKEKIHPAYNEEIEVPCSCGKSIKVGSTAKELSVEVCSSCHPFYTGKQKLVDVAGRIDKFKKRAEQAEIASKAVKNKSDKKDKGKKTDSEDGTVKLG